MDVYSAWTVPWVYGLLTLSTLRRAIGYDDVRRSSCSRQNAVVPTARVKYAHRHVQAGRHEGTSVVIFMAFTLSHERLTAVELLK